MTGEELTKLDDNELRREVTRALELGPWEHSLYYDDRKNTRRPEPGRLLFYCGKCKKVNIPACAMVYGPKIVDEQDTCPVPDAAQGSWADLAERLSKNVLHRKIVFGHFLNATLDIMDMVNMKGSPWVWFSLESSPRERVVVCLLALQGENT